MGLTKLLGLNYEIHYRSEKEYIIVDAFLKREDKEYLTIRMVVSKCIKEVLFSYENDELIKEFTDAILLDKAAYLKYEHRDTIMRYK